MKKAFVAAMLLCMTASIVCAQLPVTVITADTSCRTEGPPNDGTNKHDSRKLSVRRSSSGNKSWIRFHLGDFDGRAAGTATLTVYLGEGKAGDQSFDVSYVNDDCLDNIEWAEREITWNNAPGNNIADLGLLDPEKTTLLTTLNFTDGPAGMAFEIDALPAILSDTDGVVQFVLHNSPNLLQFATHDHPDNPEWAPTLSLTELHKGANDPVPGHQAVVETSLSALSWTNPDPNDGVSPITCDVWFGTDPNRLQMDKVTLPAGASSVDLAVRFPRFMPLVNNRTYYWAVDCTDPSLAPADTLLPGLTWSFYTDNNNPPVVDAGPDQVAWLGMSGTPGQEVIDLSGVVSDDGLPKPPGQYTVQWTQVANGAPEVAPTPDNAPAATVTITARGVYEFMLTADDGGRATDDTVRIVVGNDACDASHMSTNAPYNAADQNNDCIVNLEDFAILIVDNWLDCTDTLTGCGM